MQAPATQRQLARFGPFLVDLASHELHNNGQKISLQEKPFGLLAILLDHPGEVVTREELRKRLWPADTFVDFEHSINTAIKKLREALEDSAEEPCFIETLPKRGYRFIAQLEPPCTEGKTRPQAQADSAYRKTSRDRFRELRYVGFLAAILLVGIILVGLAFNRSLRQRWQPNQARSLAAPIESIAVLPLENLSGNPDEQYFADGLTDSLITDLGKVAGLRVISRTSVMSYRNTSKPLPQIARELNVDAIVEGTVLRSGNRLRVTAQLIRASPEEHLWAERYERGTEEAIRVEQHLALAIAHQITGRLVTTEESHVINQQNVSANAYDTYLRGRYLWNERSAKPASEARAYFEQALREDPGFALAYSGLADYYTVGWGPWIDLPLAENYARKAAALAPGLAEAHASLGIAAQYQRHFDQAGKELRQAIDLSPNYVMAHHWYSLHLLSLGRTNDALAENDRARRLDPFSFPINFFRAAILTGMHEYGQAREQLETAGAINPQAPGVHQSLARIYWLQGMASRALAQEREEATLANDSTWLRDVDQIVRVYAHADLRAAQLRMARVKEKRCVPDDGNVLGRCDEFGIALQYGMLDAKEDSLRWLQRGANRQMADRNAWLVMSLKTAPEFDSVRSDPRFQKLLRSLGLP